MAIDALLDPRWERSQAELARQVMTVSPVFLRDWIEALRPVG